MKFGAFIFIFSFLPLASYSQLTVETQPLKLTASKAVVPLTLKNSFEAKIESAKASVFLLDEQGKMVGQGSRWVIGGETQAGPKAALKAGGTNVFHFVITSDKPFASTNLTPKIIFNRVVLEGGKPVDVLKDVKITPASAPQKAAPSPEKK
jgi:hypothetical protein